MTSVSTLLIILSAAALLPLAYVVHLSRHKKSSRLTQRLVGRLASVERPLTPEGFVLLDGELWPARTRNGESVGRGLSNVRVVGASGHQLEVEPTV
jgi:membrane protein implicated in regulation of membrane protease activity